MKIKANNNVIELHCEFCNTTESVKGGLTATGFMRKFNAFRRTHDDQCAHIAKRDVALEKSVKITDAIIKTVSGIDVTPDIQGTRSDPFYAQAKAIVLEAQRASVSLVQRRLFIGFNHAARLIEAMEGDILAPPGPNSIRPILIP